MTSKLSDLCAVSDRGLWYLDRDFPEVKACNSDIVAVILHPLQRKRVMDEHNKLVGDYDALLDIARRYEQRNERLEKALEIATDVINAEIGAIHSRNYNGPIPTQEQLTMWHMDGAIKKITAIIDATEGVE